MTTKILKFEIREDGQIIETVERRATKRGLVHILETQLGMPGGACGGMTRRTMPSSRPRFVARTDQNRVLEMIVAHIHKLEKRAR